MNKLLIICGPTATGKTLFGIEMAKKFGGEIVSADSRQVYVGKDQIHGKDLPSGSKPIESSIKWEGRTIKYYETGGIRVWLYDVVKTSEEFSVSSWQKLAQLVIEDILSRQKLPIIVGGTGLYIKSLTHNLEDIHAPRNLEFRKEAAKLNAEELYNRLLATDPQRATGLNESDRKNPRRLIRAIEISEYKPHTSNAFQVYNFLQIGLSAPLDKLLKRIDRRVDERIEAGAAAEDPDLAANSDKWKVQEHQIARQQLAWFNKQPNIKWFDVTVVEWMAQAQNTIEKWYNS